MAHVKTLLKKLNDGKDDCTGCSACMNSCPTQAISMLRNKEGFWEPYVDKEKCSECGLCKCVCHLKAGSPVAENREPIYYAAFSKDMNNVRNSSSGGIFYELCKTILNQSGTVYGAVQVSVYNVSHQRGTTLKDVTRFRRSKYLESSLGSCYKDTELDLKKGRKVLFSGVGCQIAGLYNYLRKDYENLYTCEVVCHGVPSYLAYKKYLTEKSRWYGAAVCGINFRDKSLGWKENSICEYFENDKEAIISSNIHPLHSLYLKGINMRTVCGSCQYAHIPRTADITLADYWEYEGCLTELNQNTGISLVAVNNSKGRQLLQKIEKSIYLEITDKKSALKSCRHMGHTPFLHKTQSIFMKMIQSIDFHFVARLCTSFSEVVEESELCKITDTSLENVLSIFFKDEQEMIYVLGQDNKPYGIITCGNFIQNLTCKEHWINEQFQKVFFSENCVEEMQEIFKKNSQINRIPVMDQEGDILFEVRRKIASHTSCLKDMLRSMEPFLRLYVRGTRTYFVKRPDLLPDYAYTKAEKKRIEDELSFPKLSEDIEANETLLRSLFKEKFSPEYLRELQNIPRIVKINGRYQHVDHMSEYVNVVNGCRKTYCQPKEYDYTIHMYGRCGIFGYAVEDTDTIPSVLQHLFNQTQQKIRVVNHGLWGADNEKILHNLSVDIEEGVIGENDQVVLYMDYISYITQIQDYLYIYDSTCSFHQFMKNKVMFYDRPGHMSAEGYQYIAEYIYQILERTENSKTGEKKKHELNALLSYAERIKEIEEKPKSGSFVKELEQYLSSVEKEISLRSNFRSKIYSDKKTGAIVMNCNPFTKGHRYLIEMSAKEVEILLVFVVEEDKSYFSFQDRFRMVREGTKDLKNVYVLSGGRFMISALTFPEYFIKEKTKEVEINPAMDVQIFAKQIAPRLHISVRFAGTEPEDKVTNQYNDTLREILPCYGIEFREIKRFEQMGQAVTATEVRKLIGLGKRGRLKKLVPESTYNYLEEHGYLKEQVSL